jgi:hypothetical protein
MRPSPQWANAASPSRTPSPIIIFSWPQKLLWVLHVDIEHIFDMTFSFVPPSVGAAHAVVSPRVAALQPSVEYLAAPSP